MPVIVVAVYLNRAAIVYRVGISGASPGDDNPTHQSEQG
jgi:hypothetical protein